MLIPKYYKSIDGVEPVRDFIGEIELPAARLIVRDQIRLLGKFEQLPFPHTSQIDGPLRELRCHYGPTLYRILYQRRGRFLILLHIFRKSTQQTPPAEIAIGKARWNDVEERFTAEPRQPPRPIGADAP